MRLGRTLKRKAIAALPSLFFLSLTGYFLWSATQGARGLNAFATREEGLAAAKAQLVRAKAEEKLWERKVSGLRADHLDLDALDERSRAMLGLSRPNEIVVPYGEGKRLF